MLVPERANQRWSTDFQHDVLAGGQRLRTLNIVDDASRDRLAIVLDSSPTSVRVTRALDRLTKTRRLPQEIVLDNVLCREGISSHRPQVSVRKFGLAV